MVDGSSLLLDLDGVVVESVQRLSDGTRLVVVRTAPEWVGICPECGERSTRSKGWVATSPRDVQVGPDRPLLRWRKRKWLCPSVVCDRKVFTEAVPGVPARTRITPRAKASMATEVLDNDRSVAAVASEYRCGWHTVHDHVIAVADAVLEDEPAPVRVLGIDETRRGKAKWETEPDTGRRLWVDRWDTGLVDITEDQGLLVQVNGRTSAVVIDWLAERDPAWRAQITHVAIDMSAVYARAVRLGLPDAVVIVDRFHLVKKANDMLDAVRRRVTLAQRGRRGRKTDVEWINRRRLLRGAERLTSEQRATLFAKLLSADPGEDIAASWIAKELLRELLSCAQRGGLRYEIQTGLTNARTEGYNRIVKDVGRIAFGFRNPDNQRRRVRWACTRQSRRVTPSRHQCHCQLRRAGNRDSRRLRRFYRCLSPRSRLLSEDHVMDRCVEEGHQKLGRLQMITSLRHLLPQKSISNGNEVALRPFQLLFDFSRPGSAVGYEQMQLVMLVLTNQKVDHMSYHLAQRVRG